MAIFGAPVFSEDHASDAAAAAIEMQATMAQINLWNRERSYPRLEMGIGLNTGEVIVGNIGSEKRTKYGVVGSQVNLCGRIESYTVGGQVLISPKTRSLVDADLEIAQEMEVFPKGVKEALKLSQVTGIGAPYDLHCAEEIEAPAPLTQKINVCFAALVSKHGSVPDHAGAFTALSETGAILQTELPLNPFDNLKIEAGGELFAKVIRREGEGWLLRFTALPAGFAAWRAENVNP
jgi:adenylate cyclase